MREVVFRLEAERPDHLEAQDETLPIRITAPTLEELQHEAREALIEHMGQCARPPWDGTTAEQANARGQRSGLCCGD